MADTHVLEHRKVIRTLESPAPIVTAVESVHRQIAPAYRILHLGFIVAPILAGLDKFFHYMVNWDMYLAPRIERILPFSGPTFMLIVGVIEVVAGLIVAFAPHIGGFIVAAWLAGIIVNLLMIPGFYDIALRDLGLCFGALALGILARARMRKPVVVSDVRKVIET